MLENRNNSHCDALLHQRRQEACCRSSRWGSSCPPGCINSPSFCSAQLILVATAKLTFQPKLQMQFHFCQESRPRVTAYSDADQRLCPTWKLTSTPSVKENNCRPRKRGFFTWSAVRPFDVYISDPWSQQRRTSRKMIKSFSVCGAVGFWHSTARVYDLWCHSSPHNRPNWSKLSLKHQNHC